MTKTTRFSGKARPGKPLSNHIRLSLILLLIAVVATGCSFASSRSATTESAMPAEAPAVEEVAAGEMAADVAYESEAAPPPANQRGDNLPNAADQSGYTLPNAAAYDDVFFKNYGVNPFIDTEDDPLSTFAMDVDTASYTLARNYLLNLGQLPPPEAIRPEEFINYFEAGYEGPTDNEAAFAIHLDSSLDMSGSRLA